MPQFPISDQQAIVDGLNYVLSGPGSLGQNFQGYSSNSTTTITGNIIDPTTGETVNSLPITTSFLQYYLTDCVVNTGVTGGTDRVVLSAQLSNSFVYTTTAACSLQYTVSINRYRALANRDTTSFAPYVYTYAGTVATQDYFYNLDTTTAGILSTTVAGAKPAYVAPVTGSLVLPVDQVFVGLAADPPGTGQDANLRVQIAYGAAGAYDATNTKILVNSAGSLWNAGETITIPGTGLGGATPANDMTVTVSAVTALTPSIQEQTVFTSVIDEPGLGYYLYALEVRWYALTGSIDIASSTMQTRSISAQVVKQ